jgi:hypothetical protein
MSRKSNSDGELCGEELVELRPAIEELRDYVQVLTRSIDDLTMELWWQHR